MKLKNYFITVGIFFAIALLFSVVQDKLSFHLFLNRLHCPATDFFFKYTTHLGDGIVGVLALPLLLFSVSVRKLCLGLLTCLLSAVFVQFLKRVVFSDYLRPAALIDNADLHLVSGVSMYTLHSFPSGHTTFAFAFFTFLAFAFQQNKKLQIGIAVMAIVVSYSRVYLSQHFLQDVAAGCLLGVVSFLVAYWIYKTIKRYIPNILLTINFRQVTA
ncbi:MAG: phosphatase PAP2 family protein [Capnocytophaga sp.]|nr:phosphatase PAP2 family protein [Capnocytophaga sp.]